MSTAPPEFAAEPTGAGMQTLIPAVSPITSADRLSLRAEAPMRSKSSSAPAPSDCSISPRAINWTCSPSFHRPADNAGGRSPPTVSRSAQAANKNGPALTRSAKNGTEIHRSWQAPYQQSQIRHAEKAPDVTDILPTVRNAASLCWLSSAQMARRTPMRWSRARRFHAATIVAAPLQSSDDQLKPGAGQQGEFGLLRGDLAPADWVPR